MKLIKFRVRDYKSIADSGDCYFSDGVTIFAGKNESGKTSLLEALEDFDTNKKIEEKSIPIQDSEKLPTISITFLVEKDTLKEVFEEIGSDRTFKGDINIELIKSYPDVYSLSQESREALDLKDIKAEDAIKKTIEKDVEKIKASHEQYPQIASNLFSVSFDNLVDFKNSVQSFKDEAVQNQGNIPDETERSNFLVLVTELIENIEKLKQLEELESEFIKSINQWVPNFILFNSFDDILPNKISFTELEQNALVKDLSIISDLDATKIKSSADRIKHKHKKDINITLNDDYKKYWTQDVSNLSVDWDSEHLHFWVEEDGFPYEPSLRSKGRQWHLAFYIRVSARAREDVPNIILIDEPGLFLHAKAQKDILNSLEESSKNAQIIFSTHSPYLLEASNLSRIRLIYRTKKDGTKVENKVHVLADKETLTPIMTAIGLDLISGILNVDKKNNIVVEGPSDLYYLESFKKLTKTEDLNFIFGGGAGNMPVVGTILHGWGSKVYYLYDNDQGKKDGEKNLKDNWCVTKDLVLAVIEDAGSIEDVFSLEDFKTHVLKGHIKGELKKNSEYMKKNKLDKVLAAKLFLESIDEGIELSEETMANVNNLFEKIKKVIV